MNQPEFSLPTPIDPINVKTINKIRIGGHKFAQPSSIVKLEACENYTNIEFKCGKKLVVATTLGILQERLRPFGFCWPNRGTGVNLNFISRVEEKASVYSLKLRNKEKLKVSKRRVQTIIHTVAK